MPAVGAYCCAFGCATFKNAGKNIGYWPNCGESTDGGIQYGMRKAGFEELKNFTSLQAMDAIILDRPKGLTFDHFCFSLGEYRTNNGTREIKTIGGNPNEIVWFPVSQIIRAFRPCWETEKKNGWYKEQGMWFHYTDGAIDRNKVIRGDGDLKKNYYYVDANGHVVTNRLMKRNGKWYYAARDGHILRNENLVIKAKDNGELYIP